MLRSPSNCSPGYDEQQYTSNDFVRLILRVSAQLADCEPSNVESIIRSTLSEVCTLESADHILCFPLSQGDHLESLISASVSPGIAALIGPGLHKLPWCRTELAAGRAVIVSNVCELFTFAPIDHLSLSNQAIRSIALIPFSLSRYGTGVLGLLSTSDHIYWSDRLEDHCSLLGNIFLQANQRQPAPDRAELNQQHFEQCFTESALGMAILNEQGRFLLVNQAFTELLGYTDDELRKMQCSEIVKSIEAGNSIDLSELRSHTPSIQRQIERTLVRKDRTLLSARLKVGVLRRPTAEASPLLMMVEDISEQRKAEDELTRSQGHVKTLAARLIQFQENERNRLSRELHDDIGQRLSLVTSEVALLVSRIHPASTDLLNRLSTVRDDLGTLCSDIHALSHTLHSYKLQHLGLKPALRELCARLSQPGFLVTLGCDGSDEPKSKTISLCLYRIAQEALNNALRHARTPVVTVTLTKVHNTYSMTVQDFGVGFAASSTPRGLGLVSMKERLTLVNGQLKVRSSAGRGTEVWVAIPEGQNVSEPVVQYRPAPTFQASSPKREVA
jgi:PAS domain S-box-containing protein